jgi:Icc-related predicted phosphoesterase
MKLLAISDLHYSLDDKISENKLDALRKINNSLDLVVLCGDNAGVLRNFNNHHKLFSFLKEKFSCPIAFVCGNHDLWTKKIGIDYKKALYEVYPKIAGEHGLHYLEQENLKIGNFTIAGTYGHYDYSLARYSRAVTKENIESYSIFAFESIKTWRDGEKILKINDSDKTICDKLLDNFDLRLEKIDNKKLITVSHTIPSKRFSGHKDSFIQDWYLAYSGSRRLEKIIKKYSPRLHLCGHTHAIYGGKLGNTQVINIGSDYNILRYCIVQLKKEISIERFELDFRDTKYDLIETMAVSKLML